MNKIRRKFTLWYIKKGYTFGYDFTDVPIYDDGIFKTPCGVPKAIWNCPRWIKPFLVFFSPSVYEMETTGKAIIEGFMAGLEMGMNK